MTRQMAQMGIVARLRQRARLIKRETYALYLACRDPRAPWYAKLFASLVVAYAVSPIDLIPDFIPVLGYLDDLLLVPLGIVIAIRLIPAPIMDDCRRRAEESLDARAPHSRTAAIVIVAIWLVLAALATLWAYRAFVTG